jgi:hypothetical protein
MAFCMVHCKSKIFELVGSVVVVVEVGIVQEIVVVAGGIVVLAGIA